MTAPGDEWIPFGTLSRAHGVHGEIRLVPHHPDDSLPAAVTEIAVGEGEGQRPMRLAGVRSTRGAFLVRIEGITDRDAAQALAGRAVAVRREHLPPLGEGEFYLFELQGALVVDAAGATLGRVRRVDALAVQDLLVIDAPAGELLLPMVPQTIVSYRRAEHTLIVAVPEGLWEPDAGDGA